MGDVNRFSHDIGCWVTVHDSRSHKKSLFSFVCGGKVSPHVLDILAAIDVNMASSHAFQLSFVFHLCVLELFSSLFDVEDEDAFLLVSIGRARSKRGASVPV